VFSADQLHPRQVRLLPAATQLRLIDLLATVSSPRRLVELATMIVFIPEAGREKAGWLRNAVAAFAKGRGLAAGSLFLDIAKSYENLRHDALWRRAIAHGFKPPPPPRPAGDAPDPADPEFRESRLVDFHHAAALAGRACATAAAKLPALGALQTASLGGRPLAVARNAAGDLAPQAVGTERPAARQLGSADPEVARLLGQGHPHFSAAKTSRLASSPALSKRLGDLWKGHGWTFHRAMQARHLGTDADITRRGAHAGQSRAVGASTKARRLRCLKAAGAQVDLILKAGPAAGMVLGRTTAGISDGELRCWRATAARGAGKLPSGAALGFRLLCAEAARRRDLDPSAPAIGPAAQTLAALLQSGELPSRALAKGPETAAARHAAVVNPWVHCASHVDAAALTMSRIGWHFESERSFVTDQRNKLDLALLGPGELGDEAGLGARRASDRHELAKLAKDGSCREPLSWDAIASSPGPGGDLGAR
ncbi:unnamed protein product, partial [Prorocentrum cordatum]